VPQRETVELAAAQRRALLVLASEPGASLTRAEYARLTGVARSRASLDLSELVSAGLVVRVGRGRSTRYELAHEPTAQQARTPGRTRRKLVSALVGVAALGALGAAARGLPLVATHGFGSKAIRAITGLAATANPPSTRRSSEPFALRRAAPNVGAATHAGPTSKPDHDTRSAPRPAPPVQQTSAPQRTYVSNVVQAAPAQTAPASSQTSAAPTPHAAGPAPLPAPARPSPPSPLRSP
jgi:DNA-binding transcriptional ArsR family regulator